jgi:flagellar hook-associated protein 1 FlgK
MSIGLFGTLGMAARSLQTQQAGIQVTGHNLANVNNPNYARQRLDIDATLPVPSAIGLLGTGAQAVAIQQIRNLLVDQRIQAETSVSGYWDAQQQALQYGQAALGQQVNRTLESGTAGAQQGIAEGLAELFNSFQSLSTQPTSLAERQVLLMKAGTLASRFNQVADRLNALRSGLNDTIQADVSSANRLMSDIADLNDQIITAEINSGGVANDLRDLRQGKIEELAKLVNIDTAAQSNGGVNISIGGVLMVSDKNVLDSLEVYDAGGGQLLVRAATAATPLTLTGGSVAGAIDVRDGAVAQLQSELDTLAGLLIGEVNALHATGFSLTGSTGENFFTGTDAASIAVNTTLTGNPSLIQASGAAGEPGNNTVALALAQLAGKTHAGLNNQTFSQSFAQTVASLGQSLSSANGALADQQMVQEMLNQQRSAISGVSIDEEMANLSVYQRAYQASARVMVVVDEMLQTLINIR